MTRRHGRGLAAHGRLAAHGAFGNDTDACDARAASDVDDGDDLPVRQRRRPLHEQRLVEARPVDLDQPVAQRR